MGKWRVARVIIALVLRLRRAVAARVVARVSRHVGAGDDKVGAGGEMRLRVESCRGRISRRCGLSVDCQARVRVWWRLRKEVPSKTKDGVLASSAYRAVPRQDRTGAKRTGNGKRRGTLPGTGSWRGGDVPLAGLGWALAGGWARAWNPVSSGCVRAYVMRLDAADGCLRGSCSRREEPRRVEKGPKVWRLCSRQLELSKTLVA